MAQISVVVSPRVSWVVFVAHEVRKVWGKAGMSIKFVENMDEQHVSRTRRKNMKMQMPTSAQTYFVGSLIGKTETLPPLHELYYVRPYAIHIESPSRKQTRAILGGRAPAHHPTPPFTYGLSFPPPRKKSDFELQGGD